MIVILDYGLGNIKAFLNIFKKLNVSVKIATTESDLDGASKIILPGVGAFDYAITKLNNSGMREKLDDLVLNKKIPVLGICVGMQILANSSEEGKLLGLGYIDGIVKKFDNSTITQRTKLPHMGWNDVIITSENPLFKSLEKESLFYFLHSYYFQCNNQADAIAVTDYGVEFVSAINFENVFGVQFHPEKSHESGIQLLNNFSKL